MGAIDVKQTSEHELTLEWESSASNDMIADSTLALITGIDKSPASVKRMNFQLFLLLDICDQPLSIAVTTHSHSHSHNDAPEQDHPHADLEDAKAVGTRIQRLAMFLEAHFGEVELHMPETEAEEEQPDEPPVPALLVRLDEADAIINLVTMVCLSFAPIKLYSQPGRIDCR